MSEPKKKCKHFLAFPFTDGDEIHVLCNKCGHIETFTKEEVIRYMKDHRGAR